MTAKRASSKPAFARRAPATRSLAGRVAIVAPATRGAGRGIAIALGEAGATVYCTGRSTRAASSPLARPETIEETAELVTAAGGTGIAVRVDHTVESEIAALVQRIKKEQDGRIDVLVNDVWGGDSAGDWLWKPLHETDVEAGWELTRQAVFSHMLTTRLVAPMMIARRSGLIVEITDGDTLSYRGAIFYDHIKTSIMRLAFAMSVELRPHRIAALAVTPGFLRSEAMLERFGVTEENWRAGIKKDKHFIASETPRFVGRAVAALAADPKVLARSGQTLSSWDVAREYKLTDVDGSRPDWLAHFRAKVPRNHPAHNWMRRALEWEKEIAAKTRRFLN
jgi:NAD(P)-dependent dehydrogenase (short-subunit alcohol dehydrogenase family)